jgi:multisubunit Na+/H+ antiporter MnhF subunit
LIGSINRKTIIYKCIACYGVVAAGRGEVDAVIVVVADSIACYGVVVFTVFCLPKFYPNACIGQIQIFYRDIIAIQKNNLSRIFNLVIRYLFKINKRLAIYYIVFHCILVRSTKKETILYKCIVSNGVIVAGRDEADATIVVVIDNIAYNDVVAGRVEEDSVIVVVVDPAIVDTITCNGAVVGMEELDVVIVDTITCNGAVVGMEEVDIVTVDHTLNVAAAGILEATTFIAVANIIAGNNAVARIAEADALPVVVADIVACYCVIAGIQEADAVTAVVAYRVV